MQKNVLVTGGAGYIGSHVARQLAEQDYNVVILDNLSTGFRELVLSGTLVVGDTGDADTVSRVLKEHNIESILHFAANTVVPESVSDPLKYYRNNTANTRTLLQCAVEAGVKHLIFSSTAAVYGDTPGGIASLDTPTNPVNPYGRSKLMSEWMLQDTAAASDLRYTALRYFNVAGNDPKGRIGHSLPKATLLVKVACQHAAGLRPDISIFGTDYPTHDGTGIRDYIHVEDLASAHLKALSRLENGGESTTLNCGYGHGYSVREVLETVREVSGQPMTILEKPRRAGDPPSVVADASGVREVLGWEPQFDDIQEIVRSAWEWERRTAAGELPFAAG